MKDMPENLINRKGVIPNLPVAPAVPDQYGNPVPKKSAAETWMDALNRTNTGVIQDIPMSSVYIGDRYDNTMPGTDYEEAAAQQQSWRSKAVNSLGQMGVLAATTFLQNTIGAVNGLVEWGKTGNSSSFYNNDLNKWVDDLNKGLKDKWANYYTAAERDADWYSLKKLLSANFFWDGIISNLGFSLGTIASGALFAGGISALSRTLSTIPKVGKLFSMGKAAETLAATEEALRTANAAGRAASTYGKITELSNKFLGQYKLLNPGSRAVVAGLATSGESAFEAYHNMNEYRDNKIQEYKDANYGMSPTGEDLERINKQAEEVGNWSYIFNAAILSFTNYVQFPKIFGSSYTAEKNIANTLTHKIKDITKEGGKYGVAPTRGGRILSTLNKIRPYTFSASEAFEEGSQFAITKGTQDYFDKKYNNIPNTFLQSVMEGVYETVGTNEGMENVLIGGLSGALMLGAGKFREARALSSATDAALVEGERWTGRAGINTAGFSEFTKDTYDSVRRASYLQQQREGAIADGNILDSKDLEADYIINYLTPRIKYGRFDLVMEDINDYKQLASTEEGFAQLQQEGKALETDTRKAFMTRINLLEQTANDVKTFYQTLNLRYAGLVDDKGERIYSPEVVDKMVYASAKIADYDRRIPALSAQLAIHGINSSQIITDIVNGNVDSFNEATAKIETLNLTDDQKLDIGQALDDVAEMSLRRNKFLQEYSDIKTNPNKYKEQRVEDIPETSEGERKPTVVIKTKQGEREYEIGTEYFLGRVVEYDKNGHEVYRAPRLTIVGENEDGTIKVKTSNGQVRDISKQELQDYNLGSVANTLSNKKAKFFMEHWNTVFEFNFGKGKKKRGRLEWSGKDGRLLFTYKDDRGKVRSIEVTGDQFVAQKGYKNPMITAVGELTAVQKDALDKFKLSIDKRTEAKREERLRILTELFDEVAEKQTKIEKLLQRKKAEVTNIQEELNKLTKQIEETKDVDNRYKRTVKFKSATRKAMNAALRLTRAKEQMEYEISDLEAQREEMEMTLTYITDMAENIDTYPTSSKDFLEELNNQVIDLEVLHEETGKQINSLSKLITSIESAIDSAITFLSDLINDFQKQYPKVPLTLGQEWVDFLKSNPNFLKRKPNYKEDLQTLEELVAQVEDTDIRANEEKLKELNNKVRELQEVLSSTEKEILAKSTILDKFSRVAKEYEKKKAQEQRLKDNNIIKDALGTADKGNVQTKNREEKTYEAAFKKAIEFIWRSTIAPTRGMKPHHVRANKFGFNLEKFENRENIRGVFITSDNENLLIPGLTDYLRTDEHGVIDESIRKDSIIALVMIDESGNLVGEDGQPLTEEQLTNPLEHAIYQTMPEADLRWKMKGLEGESMFRRDEEARAESIRTQYAEYRNRIFDLSKEQTIDELIQQAHTIGASFGHPRYAEKLDDGGNVIKEKGKPILDYETRTPVSKAGLTTDEQLLTEEVLFVPTTNDVVDVGTTKYEGDNLGRPFIRMKNGVVPVQNRHHTRKEAETIFDVLLQVAKNMVDPNIGVKHDSTIRLFEWLETVVYWNIPRDQQGNRKSDAYNSVFWEVDENGNFVLALSGKGTRFIFSPSAMVENKGQIVAILEGMYNNTKVSRVKELNEPYEEILGINENGEPITRIWKNYQTYLLSDKIVTFDKSDKDNGKSRNDIPLTTIITPLEGEQDVNRTGIYFFTDDNLNEVDIPEVKKEIGIKAGKLNAPKQKPFVFDGKTHNTITTSYGEKITFTIDENNNFKVIPDEGLVAILDRWAKTGEITDPNTKEGVQQGKERINKIIQGSIELQKQTPEKQVPPKTTDPISDEDYSKFVDKGEVSSKILNSIANKIKEGKNLSIRELSIFTDKTKEVNEILKKQRDSIIRQKVNWSKGHDSGLYRLIPGKVPKFETEDWGKVEQWLKANFPNVPIYRVKNVIQATNGRQAWGMFKDGALYVYENAEVGTIYHEVFEAVWKMFTDIKEQQSIINEFKQRRGAFVDRVSGETIKYSEATDAQIKEQLAEEFRDYIHYKKIPPKPNKGRPFILKLFSDIVNFIKKLFLGKDSDSKVEELFKKIGTGGYKNNIPYSNQLSLANRGIIDIDEAFGDEYAELREVFTGSLRSQIIDSMLYYTLFDLIKNDENIFNLTDRGIKKADLYSNLKDLIINDLVNQVVDDNKTATEAQSEINIRRAEDIADSIENNWDDIIRRYEEYLKKYDIEFDENDVIAVSEYEKSREDPYGEANKVDHFKKANSALKLLLATMIEVDDNGIPKRNSTGGVKLIPLSRTVAALYNRLHNSRSVEEMMYRLKEMTKDDPNYRGLYRRLTKKDYTQGVSKVGDKYIADFSGITTQHGLRLLSSFYNLFSKQNPQVLTVTIFDTGEVAVGDTYLSTYAAQMREDYVDGIVAKAKEGSGFFTYDKKKRVFKGNPDAVAKLKLNSTQSRVKFLNDIGINVRLSDMNTLRGNKLTDFNTTVDGIRKSIEQQEEIVSISRKVLNMNDRLLELAYLEAEIKNPGFDSTFFNVNRERTQSFIGKNPVSDLHDFLSQISRFDETALEDSQYEYLLKDVFARGSSILKRMFNNGKRIQSNEAKRLLNVIYVSGTDNQQRGKTKQSSKLNYKERLIQELNINLKGYYLNLVPGDASMEWAVYMGNPVSERDVRGNKTMMQSIFKDYFIDELNLARETDRNVDSSRKVKGKNPKEMRFFKDILGSELHKEIINSKATAEEVYNKNEAKINRAIDQYIDESNKEFKVILEEYGVLDTNEAGNYIFNNVAIEEDLSKNELDTKLSFLNVNYMIANIELHKLLYGDPYQYSDELKRIKNFNSPRQNIIHSSPEMNVAFNKVWNRDFQEGDPGWTNFSQEYFRTATHEDVWSVIKGLQGYEIPYRETDGGGIISLTASRNFRIRGQDWSDNEERQYQYDMVFEKNYNKQDLTDSEKEILKAGNPKVRSAYTPIKPIVSGNKRNNNNYNDVVLDKFALYPVSLRLLMDINEAGNKKSSSAVSIYNKMRSENIDYITFESSRKVGVIDSHSNYNPDGTVNLTPYTDSQIVNVPLSIISTQTEVPSKDASPKRGTQLTKLATMDFMDAGVPIDAELRDENGKIITDISKRYLAWQALTTEQKEEQSPLYKGIMNNQRLLEAKIDLGYRGLLISMGLEERYNRGKGRNEYIVTDQSQAAQTLREEMLKREVSDNISDALAAFETGESIIEATPAYHQIRNILYSIADREVISQRINGGMKVQLPVSFLEETKTEAVEINGKQTYVSDTLKFYEEDGVTEIMIARWFDSNLSDKELLDYLNNTEEGQKILSGIGFRIPTQKQNSTEVFRIKQFLPQEFGDAVIVPSAIVNKAGSDFDIDKLTVYLKNVFHDIDGKLTIVDYKGSEEATIKFYKNHYTEKQRAKLEAITNKDEFRQNLLNILNKFETVEGKDIQQWFPNLTDMEDAFYKEYRELFEVIRSEADKRGELPSEYMQRNVDNSIIKSNNLFINLFNEEFSDKYANTKYREALENEYIQSLQNLTSHPLNRERLLKPNSAKQLEDISTFIAQKTKGNTFNYRDVGNMINRGFMSRLRHAFVSGKYAIGIAAVNQTNHSLNQRQLVYIDPDRKQNTTDEDKAWLGDMKINFEAYNKVFVEGKGNVATLSMIRNAERSKEFPQGQDISEIITQFIDGYVDISKGPWIMELGATPNVASTWLFLVKIGVPVDTVAYFMNQPIIRDYLKSIEDAGYSWLFMDNFVKEMKEIYEPSSKVDQVDKIPSKANLKSTVGKSKLTDREKAEQQFMLDEFLKYAKMATHMFYVTQGSNFDTANFNDPFLVFKKYKQLEKAQQSVISDVNEILQNSFLGKLGKTISSMRDALSEFLISDKKRVRVIIEDILTPYVDMNDSDFVRIARKVVSDLFDYAVQVDRGINNDIQDILINEGGVATEMREFMNEIKDNPTHPLYNNHIVGEKGILTTELSRRAGFTGANNIKVKGLQNSVYDQNNIIYAFREIRDFLKDKNKLYDRIVSLAILQSGLSTSSISFTSVLPYEDFVNIYQSTLLKIDSLPNLERFLSLNVFQRNNWDNDDIVPHMRARWTKTKKYNPAMEFLTSNRNLTNYIKGLIKEGEIPPVMNVWSRTRESNHDHIVYTWEQYEELAEKAKRLYPKLSKNESIKKLKAEMRKVGDFSYINRALMQKVKHPVSGEPLITSYKDKNGEIQEQYVYKAINAWGEGRRANEFYNVAKQSVIDNGFVKVEEVSDKKIIDVFSGEKVQQKATNKPIEIITDIKGINISSYESGLGYKLTNFAKIPVIFKGKKYISSEAAYQANKKDLSDKGVKSLMIDVIKAKLEQHSELVDEITKRGGLPFLSNSTHNLIKSGRVIKSDRWTGKDGLFMQSLREAYSSITGMVESRNAPPGFPETKRPDKKC